jgi:hypothetical protein
VKIADGLQKVNLAVEKIGIFAGKTPAFSSTIAENIAGIPSHRACSFHIRARGPREW